MASRRLGELAFALALTLLGVFLAVQTAALPDTAGYAQIGAQWFPALVSAGLILSGAMLGWQAWRGANPPGVQDDAPFDARAFGWVSAGLLAHLAFIGVLGFVPASVLLFVCVARACGSRRWLRDACLGLLFAAVLYFVFTRGLGLTLGPTPGFTERA